MKRMVPWLLGALALSSTAFAQKWTKKDAEGPPHITYSLPKGWTADETVDPARKVLACAHSEGEFVTLVKLYGDAKTVRKVGGLKVLMKVASSFTGFPAPQSVSLPDENPCGSPCGNPCGY